MPWKPEYQANREARMAADPDYRERVIEQRKRAARTPEQNQEYMREYYQQNKDKYKLTPEQREQRNEQRRRRYAEDPEYRRKVLEDIRNIDPSIRRDRRLRNQFGIGADEFDSILERQGGRCAICLAECTTAKGGRRAVVDHCHRTGRLRKILCSECNLGLGKFRDDPELLEQAARYLREANIERDENDDRSR
jgi:hypothetical protein